MRCGRCSSVFNALARLTEERQLRPPRPGCRGSAAGRRMPARPGAGRRTRAHRADCRTAGRRTARGDRAAARGGAHPRGCARIQPRDHDRCELGVRAAAAGPAVWAAATGSFRALVAANQDAAPSELLRTRRSTWRSTRTSSPRCCAPRAASRAGTRADRPRPVAAATAPRRCGRRRAPSPPRRRARRRSAPAAPQAIAPGRPPPREACR